MATCFKIIMNPPFSRRIFLKILREALKHSDEIACLSPIRWLQDPLAQYKKNTDYKRFSDIRIKIKDLETVKVEEATNMFGAEFHSDLGIYHLSEDGNFDVKKLQNKIIVKYLPKFIENGVISDLQDGDVKFAFPLFHGHIGEKDWCEVTSKNWNIASKVQENENHITIKLKTIDEVKNLYDTLFTKFYKYIISNMRTNLITGGLLSFLPALPDYTRSWTDKDLYEYFSLTDEEVSIIEKEII